MIMNNEQFRNKVLLIQDEAMLNEVKQLLVENGQEIDEKVFRLGFDFTNFLFFAGEIDNDWGLSVQSADDQEITLTEFKELLKQNIQNE